MTKFPRLSKGKTFISVLPENTYHAALLDVLRAVRKKNVCFVTLNKRADTLQAGLKRAGFGVSHLFFIDAVSKGSGRARNADNVLYLSSPDSLTELSIAISEVLRTNKFDALIFDSLSTLLMFDKGNRCERFASSMIRKTKASGALGLFTCMQGDTDTPLIRSSCLVADKLFTVQARGHATHRAVAAAALVALSIGGFFVTVFGGQGAVGAAVTVPTPSYAPVAGVLFLAAVIPALTLAYLIHKTHLLQPVAKKVLLSIKPKKVNDKVFKNRCRKKIYNWLDSAALRLL